MFNKFFGMESYTILFKPSISLGQFKMVYIGEFGTSYSANNELLNTKLVMDLMKFKLVDVEFIIISEIKVTDLGYIYS